MKPDTLVFDIETQNFFTDPGVGWDNYEALKISAVGVYSYEKDTYECFLEHEMERIAELFEKSARIVGFSINRYDVPVLNIYFQRLKAATPNLWNMERVDLLEKIESAVGTRISLSKLAEANLGVKKDRHGSEAISLYRDGKIDELKEYCLKDVRLTKELFDLYERDKFLLVPNKTTGELAKVNFAGAAAALF